MHTGRSRKRAHNEKTRLLNVRGPLPKNYRFFKQANATAFLQWRSWLRGRIGTADLGIHSHLLVVISEASLKSQFDAGSTEVGVRVGSHTRSSEREAAKTQPAAIALPVLPRLHRSPVAGKSEYLPAARRLNL